jgi:hypothetical protein
MFFHKNLVQALDSDASFVDNLKTLNGASIRRRPRACEHHKASRIAGRASFGFLVLLVFVLLGLLNLAGCVAFTASLNTAQSQANSSASAAPAQATPVHLQALPASVGFGNVIAGANYTQTLVLSNVGTSDLTLDQVVASGSGFGVSGFSLPLTLTAGQSASLAVAFDSTTFGVASGTVTIGNTATGSPTTIALSATVAAAAVQITASPTSVNFGSTTVGMTANQNVALTNTGNSSVTISSVAASGSGFTVSGAPNVTLAPNQTVNVTVIFDPTATGAATGSLIVTSNAPQVQIALLGAGASPGAPSVTLNWSPSTSVVVGYYVYRGTGANPQLSKLSAIDPSTSYEDTTVVAGQTYTYAVTSVGPDSVESALSTPVSVAIPSQ